MRAHEITEVNIDNQKGWGSVPDNQEIDYKGLRVAMRPSTFIKLAKPLDSEPAEKILQHIQGGGSIGAPFLLVNIPADWEDGAFALSGLRADLNTSRLSTIIRRI
jgi:hypothetical protein